LVAPVLAEWKTGFQKQSGVSVNYQSVGSGQGITDVTSRLVDFGASDAPMTPSQYSACGCIQAPWALSATGIGWHINGIGSLKLTGSVLAKIYLGQIRKWNDPSIKKLNKGQHLPNLKITPVYRLDGSGDSYAFTDYLSRVSGKFKHSIGTGTQPKFSNPAAVGGNKNTGVAAVVKSTNGAIGYIAVSYLAYLHIPAAAIQNNAGRYEYPNLPNIEAAAQAVHGTPAQNAYHIVDPPKSARKAYPISTFTYVIIPTNAPQGPLLKQWVDYVLGPGQAFDNALDFAAMPGSVVNAAKSVLNQIH
jgi:phosphate transport system substrate-binding protein